MLWTFQLACFESFWWVGLTHITIEYSIPCQYFCNLSLFPPLCSNHHQKSVYHLAHLFCKYHHHHKGVYQFSHLFCPLLKLISSLSSGSVASPQQLPAFSIKPWILPLSVTALCLCIIFKHCSILLYLHVPELPPILGLCQRSIPRYQDFSLLFLLMHKN